MDTKEKAAATNKWAAERFGIPENEVDWYNHGICYDRIIVTTKTAADAVTEAVSGYTVNGGMFHGMGLGGQTQRKADDGSIHYDVMC